MNDSDSAALGRLPELLARLGDGLEKFLAFDAPDRTVADRPQWSAALGGPLPRTGIGIDAVVDEVLTWVVPNGLRTPHPGFSGYIVSRPTTAGIVAGTAATVAGHLRDFLSSFSHLEGVGLAWLAELCGLAPQTSGVFSGGGSTANLLGLGAARQAAFEELGVDVAAEGLPAGARVAIYGSGEVHHTVHRAAAVLGLGRRAFTAVDSDPYGRVDPEAVRRRIRADREAGVLPLAIVAVAGTTSTGHFDPIGALADVASAEGVWLHVDGAYGLVARCLPELDVFEGVDRADSAIVDPHKWLSTPVGCGATYVRDGGLLERAFTQEPAAYLETFTPEQLSSQFDHLGPGWFDRSIELHAPSRGSWVWAVLREIGLEGVQARLRRHIRYATTLADLVATSPHLEVALPPSLSICCFRHVGGDDRTAELLRRLRRDTPYVPSTAQVGGRLAIRACFVNPATATSDVEGLAEAASEIAATIDR